MAGNCIVTDGNSGRLAGRRFHSQCNRTDARRRRSRARCKRECAGCICKSARGRRLVADCSRPGAHSRLCGPYGAGVGSETNRNGLTPRRNTAQPHRHGSVLRSNSLSAQSNCVRSAGLRTANRVGTDRDRARTRRIGGIRCGERRRAVARGAADSYRVQGSGVASETECGGTRAGRTRFHAVRHRPFCSARIEAECTTRLPGHLTVGTVDSAAQLVSASSVAARNEGKRTGSVDRLCDRGRVRDTTRSTRATIAQACLIRNEGIRRCIHRQRPRRQHTHRQGKGHCRKTERRRADERATILAVALRKFRSHHQSLLFAAPHQSINLVHCAPAVLKERA